jgi:hypothetical protein
MGKQMKLKFVPEGFEAILCSEGARAACEEAGGAIQARANANLNADSEGYAMSSRTVTAYGSLRNMTFVYTTDKASIIAEAEDKALSKAVY